jgi:Ca-activated chloride channel homolog
LSPPLPSRVASLKFLMPRPMPRPISGRRLAPKIRMMMNTITTSSGRPRRPNMTAPSITRGVLANSITFGVAAAVFLCSAFAGASQFTSSVNVVEVYASVTDARGEPITGLGQQAFILRENGERQTISTFAAGEFPLAVAVAIDRSFSMTGERLAVAKSAARIFLGELRPGDESMIIAIGSQVDVVAPLSSERAPQLAALSRLDAFGTTGLYDAIIHAIDAVQAGRGRRALVLLSDGDDRYSTAPATEALERARRSDVLVYPVALGRERPPVFAELATRSGGRSFHMRDTQKLPDTLRAIARDLRHQYLIGYTPSKPIVPGSGEWRSISVSVDRPDVRVRARDGYLVK